jgi:GDP-L-fucose synthase
VSEGGFWQGRDVRVTGGTGFLGGHLVELIRQAGADVAALGSADADLRDAAAARQALAGADTVFHLAAVVGGIGFNRRHGAALAHDNMLIGANVFEAARLGDVRKLVCAGSVCAYPAQTPVPFREEAIWDGYPEASNAPYGLAKRMLVVLAESYRRDHGLDACVPVITNLYGPGDDYDLEDSHVVAALIRKFTEAVGSGERVVLWGSGEPTRELLHVRDAARALMLAGERLEVSDPVNIGSGESVRIRDLASIIAEQAGFAGEVDWDSSRPDGQRERRLDVSRARELIGFEARIGLEDGLAETIAAFRRDELGAA